jgi:hypothetical protein
MSLFATHAFGTPQLITPDVHIISLIIQTHMKDHDALSLL